jgi:hypothetical protein
MEILNIDSLRMEFMEQTTYNKSAQHCKPGLSPMRCDAMPTLVGNHWPLFEVICGNNQDIGESPSRAKPGGHVYQNITRQFVSLAIYRNK